MLRPAAVLLLVLVVSCSDSDDMSQPNPPGPITLRTQEVATGLTAPLYLTSPPSNARLFIVEQPGRIRIVRDGQLLATPFLDITAKVSYSGERGLLSVAFHPQYATNGFFFVDYTDVSGNTRIERYHVSSNADVADAASAKLILGVTQPFANHNGGLVTFGPDGMLYIGMGDGGSSGDPQNNAQNLQALLGKLLRINVDQGDPYAIPANNPFANRTDARGEIWALGLRNPWRFAFDRTAGDLYIADVGQNKYEEIDVVRTTAAGLNYGWRLMEGDQCFQPSTGCATAGLTLPILRYTHDDGCSITGGYVYRGQLLPEIVGEYFYSDYCSGFLRSVKVISGTIAAQHEWSVGSLGGVLSFGEDSVGELYILSSSGKVWRIARGS